MTRCASRSCGSCSTPSTRRHFENEISIQAPRRSSWRGADISWPMHNWRCLFIWNGLLALSDEAVVLREAIQEFFGARAVGTRQRLRDLSGAAKSVSPSA